MEPEFVVKATHRPLPSTRCPDCGEMIVVHATAGSEHERFERLEGGAWLETFARMVRVGAGRGSHRVHECRRVYAWRGGDAA